MVLIIPNSDPIFDNDAENFSKLLKDLLESTIYLQIVLILEKIDDMNISDQFYDFIEIQNLKN